mmetsp:Transcript_110214/g.218961  ORF Transcript_110214/g.218961 Transcript_110214/m.218961 type:complete len:207 (+) Transcript_110214:626-1246(+)
MQWSRTAALAGPRLGLWQWPLPPVRATLAAMVAKMRRNCSPSSSNPRYPIPARCLLHHLVTLCHEDHPLGTPAHHHVSGCGVKLSRRAGPRKLQRHALVISLHSVPLAVPPPVAWNCHSQLAVFLAAGGPSSVLGSPPPLQAAFSPLPVPLGLSGSGELQPSSQLPSSSFLQPSARHAEGVQQCPPSVPHAKVFPIRLPQRLHPAI